MEKSGELTPLTRSVFKEVHVYVCRKPLWHSFCTPAGWSAGGMRLQRGARCNGWTPNSCSIRAPKGNTWHHSEFVLKCLCSVLHLILLSDDLGLYGVGIVLSLRAWLHTHCVLMVDVSYIIHAQFTACWHVMMYHLCSEYDLRKRQAVRDNNARMSTPVCIRVCLHYIQMDLLRSSM